MRLWAKMLPHSTVLCADSFFGSHGHAEEFAAQRRPFLMLSKRDKRDAGLTRTAALTREGDVAHAIVADKNYELAEPEGGAQTPTLGPLPYQLLVWGGGTRKPEREPSPSGRSMLPEILACRRWGQPNGVANAPTGEANDLEPRCACLHGAARDRECLCHRQGIWDWRTRRPPCGNSNGISSSSGTLAARSSTTQHQTL